jgi:uncharacterized membrane protein YbhN (UPF0104 family)
VSKKVRLACSVLLLALLAWRTNWHQVAESFAHLNWGLWLLAVLVYVGCQTVSSVRWQALARPLGFDQPLRRFVAFYYIGMFFNLVLPTSVGGDVVRAWYLADAPRSHKRPACGPGDGLTSGPLVATGSRLDAFLSVFVERLSGLLVLLAIACTAAALCPLSLPVWVPWTVWGLTAVGLVSLPVLIGLARLPCPWQRLRGPHARLVRFSEQLLAAARLYLRHPRLVIGTTLLSGLVQAGNVILVYLIGLALGAPVPASYYWIVAPLVALLTLLPISLNGMGIREGAMVVLLRPVGVGSGTAVSLAFLWFAAGTVVSLGGVGFYLLGGYPRPAAEAGPSADAATPEDPCKEQRTHGPVRGDSDQGRMRQPPAAA